LILLQNDSVKFKKGSKVKWKWLGRFIEGVVKQSFTKPVAKVIKGKSIKRNGSLKKPAYLVESEAGNLALKLESELQSSSEESKVKSAARPSIFRK